ncbi:MAG: hypothetical protein ACRC7S_09200 [Cetobacterium sp.]
MKNLYNEIILMNIGTKIQLEDGYILECIGVEEYKLYNDIEADIFYNITDLLDYLSL